MYYLFDMKQSEKLKDSRNFKTIKLQLLMLLRKLNCYLYKCRNFNDYYYLLQSWISNFLKR